MPKIHQIYAKDMLKIWQICLNMPMIFQRYAKDIPKICKIYAKYMPKICQRFARSNYEATFQENYLKLRYAKDMPGVNSR